MKIRKDRRIERTRKALLNAFNELFLTRRNETIRVSDIVEHANVGRSTFYEHYASADHLYMQALAGPFSILADALAGRGEPSGLRWLLEHFRENRQRARITLTGRQRDQVTRLLADLVAERLAECEAQPVIPVRLAALQLAEAALALIRGWIGGEASCTAGHLAQTICASAAAMRGTLFQPEPEDSGG